MSRCANRVSYRTVAVHALTLCLILAGAIQPFSLGWPQTDTEPLQTANIAVTVYRAAPGLSDESRRSFNQAFETSLQIAFVGGGLIIRPSTDVGSRLPTAAALSLPRPQERTSIPIRAPPVLS